MKREEAIELLEDLDGAIEDNHGRDYDEAFRMAIDALQNEVVRCKDCKYQEHCHQTVSHTKIYDDFKEHWSEMIEWCSRGERKGSDSE